MARLRALLGRGSTIRAHFPIEVRFASQDGMWLSPAAARGDGGAHDGGGDGGGVVAFVGIIMYRPYGFDAPGTREYFSAFNDAMAALGGRPHWAKEFDLRGDAGFQALYPQWAAFKALRAELDPQCLWVNPWLADTLGIDGVSANT